MSADFFYAIAILVVYAATAAWLLFSDRWDRD